MELTQNNYNITRNGGLEYYALGIGEAKKPQTNYLLNNKGYRSTSSDLLERNYFSIKNKDYQKDEKFKTYSTIKDQDIIHNNYLKPLNAYEAKERFNLPTNMTNIETYNLTKSKIFTKDKTAILKKGEYIDKKNFNEYKLKTNYTEKDPNSIKNKNIRTLKDNHFVFDRNLKQMIRTKPPKKLNVYIN